MKNLVLSLTCMVLLSAFGQVARAENSPYEVTLRCSLSDSYIGIKKSLNFKLYGSDLLGFVRNGDEVEFSWSQTECEDLTALTVKEKKLKDLISGAIESISPQLKHEGPDLNLTATISCKLK